MLLGILFWHYTDLIWFEHFYIFPTCEWFLNSDHKTWSEVKSQSVVSDSLQPHGLYSSWNSSGQNTGVGSLSILQGNLPNPGIEPRSPTFQANCLPAERVLYQLRKSLLPVLAERLGLTYILQADFYQLSHKGSPRILEWVIIIKDC